MKNPLLSRGAKDVIVKSDLERKLSSGEKLRVKFGIDPTSPKIHIGHAATIRKLKYFQDAGHTVVLIVGDFTARIGDPSDKESERLPLSDTEIKQNIKDYKRLLAKVLDIKAAEVHYNSEWFKAIGLSEWLLLNQQFTVAQMVERDNFEKRFKANKRIGLQEFQYPIMQGYDSFAVRADLEVGGTDQLFNLLAGRTVQKYYKQKPQDIITYELLLGPDGRKMSKSWGNCIWIDDDPKDMFGKVMTINDELMYDYFRLVAEVGDKELASIKRQITAKHSLRDLKMKLAHAIVALYHGSDKAKTAQASFQKQFQKGELPNDIPKIQINKSNWKANALLVEIGLASSKSEANRLLAQNGVKLNSLIIEQPDLLVVDKDVIQVGKRKFIRLRVK